MSGSQGNPRIDQNGAAAERERLRRVYDAYDANPRYRRLWSDGPALRFMQDRKWEVIARVFSRLDLSPENLRVLDLGAGDQGDSARFTDLGVPVSGVVAFDLRPAYTRRMRESNRGIGAVSGDAASLPFQDESFQIVYQSTMISSLLDFAMRRAVFAEVARVLVPGGVFISYDVRYRNPWNPNTRPLTAKDLRAAFEGWPLTTESVTGVPQLLRLMAPIAIGACRLLELVRPLRTHLLTVCRKPRSVRDDRSISRGAQDARR